MTMPIPGAGSPQPAPRTKSQRRAKRVETVSGTGAGAVGSVFGASKLRDAYVHDKPGNDVKLRRATTHAGVKAIEHGANPGKVSRVVRAVETEHPNFKAVAGATALGATAAAAHRYQEIEAWAHRRKSQLVKAETRRTGPPVRVAVPKRGARHAVKPYEGAHRTVTALDRAKAAYRVKAIEHGPKLMRMLDTATDLMKADGVCVAEAAMLSGMGAMSAFGVPMLDPVSKASATGTPGDKRNTKYAAATYGGAAVGGAVGRQVATRTAGTSPGDVNRLVHSYVPDLIARGPSANVTRHLERGGFKGGYQAGRTAVKEGMGAMARDVPGAARMIRGGKVGAAVGAVAAPAAYAVHRRRKAETVTKSAFGVEMLQPVVKASAADPDTGKEPSSGRYIAGYLASPIHGAVAGKKGKKLRAAGNEIAGSGGGALLGSAIGAATRKPALGQAASLGAAVSGSALAVRHNQRRGYYKPEH